MTSPSHIRKAVPATRLSTASTTSHGESVTRAPLALIASVMPVAWMAPRITVPYLVYPCSFLRPSSSLDISSHLGITICMSCMMIEALM